MLWALIGLWSLVGWTLLRYERLSVSSWDGKRGYLKLVVALTVVCSLVMVRAWAYRQELRAVIASCR